MKKIIGLVFTLVVIGLIIFSRSEKIEYKKEIPAEAEQRVGMKDTAPKTIAKKTEKEIEKVEVASLGITIFWVNDSTPMPQCNLQSDFAHACYVPATKSVYISRDIKEIGLDFALFHEVAHSIYEEHFPKEIFKSSPFGPDYETIANDFAWWITGIKDPEEKRFSESVLTAAEIKYFQDTCPAECVGKILDIKIPGSKSQSFAKQPFWEPVIASASPSIVDDTALQPIAVRPPVSEYHGARIHFVEDSGKEDYCNKFGTSLDGCYTDVENNIYVNNNPERPKDFVLYHEIGHFKFNTSFPTSLFADKEIMADQFGLWIMNKKYGTNPKVEERRADYFNQGCDQACAQELIELQIPGAKAPTEAFDVRI